MLELPDSWIWDSWAIDDGERFHLFFLFASRALGDPERRHRRASIGHAVSDDLRDWERMPDAIVRSDFPAIDDVAIWTGCTIRGDDNRWYLFYTGLSDDPVPNTQRVAVAVSEDLMRWQRLSVQVQADPRWYATGAEVGEEQFRDPWVWKHVDGRWHMLISASTPGDDRGDQATVGHAVSDDLLAWTVTPSIGGAGSGFGQFEVVQPVEVDDQWYLIFSCLSPELADRRRSQAGDCGMWIAKMQGPLGPVDFDDARVLVDFTRYAGRVTSDRAGELMLIAFELTSPTGFVGRLADPMPFRPLVERAFSRTVDRPHLTTAARD